MGSQRWPQFCGVKGAHDIGLDPESSSYDQIIGNGSPWKGLLS